MLTGGAPVAAALLSGRHVAGCGAARPAAGPVRGADLPRASGSAAPGGRRLVGASARRAPRRDARSRLVGALDDQATSVACRAARLPGRAGRPALAPHGRRFLQVASRRQRQDFGAMRRSRGPLLARRSPRPACATSRPSARRRAATPARSTGTAARSWHSSCTCRARSSSTTCGRSTATRPAGARQHPHLGAALTDRRAGKPMTSKSSWSPTRSSTARLAVQQDQTEPGRAPPHRLGQFFR